MNPLPPLALYIHVPWCIRKCPYCDFNSHQAPSRLPSNDYIDALIHDLRLEVTDENRLLSSIFIGGGTPSLLSADDIKRLLDTIQNYIAFAPDIEITLEAN